MRLAATTLILILGCPTVPENEEPDPHDEGLLHWIVDGSAGEGAPGHQLVEVNYPSGCEAQRRRILDFVRIRASVDEGVAAIEDEWGSVETQGGRAAHCALLQGTYTEVAAADYEDFRVGSAVSRVTLHPGGKDLLPDPPLGTFDFDGAPGPSFDAEHAETEDQGWIATWAELDCTVGGPIDVHIGDSQRRWTGAGTTLVVTETRAGGALDIDAEGLQWIAESPSSPGPAPPPLAPGPYLRCDVGSP